MLRFLLISVLLSAGPAAAQTAISEADARAFVARQEQAWNARRLDTYFAGFAVGASFTDQAYVGDKPPVSYGTSTLAEARTLAQKSLATTKSREHNQIRRVEARGDGVSVLVVSNVTSTVEAAGKTRQLCAIRRQALLRRQGRILSTGNTDTYYPCPR